MNFNNGLLSRRFVRVCGVLSVVSLVVVGCVSGPHVTHFWDDNDLKTASADKDKAKDTSKKPSTDADKTSDSGPIASNGALEGPVDARRPGAQGTYPPRPAVVAANQSSPLDAPGRATIVNFRDPAPSSPFRADDAPFNTPAAPKSASKPLTDDDVFGPVAPKRTAIANANPNANPNSNANRSIDPMIGRNDTSLSKEFDPFAETAVPAKAPAVASRSASAINPTEVAPTTSKDADPFAGLGDGQSDDLHRSLAQQKSAAPIAKPVNSSLIPPNSPEPTAVTDFMDQQPAAPIAKPANRSLTPPRSPEPTAVTDFMDQQPAAPITPQPTAPPAAVRPAKVVVAANPSRDVFDEMSDPVPTAAPKTKPAQAPVVAKPAGDDIFAADPAPAAARAARAIPADMPAPPPSPEPTVTADSWQNPPADPMLAAPAAPPKARPIAASIPVPAPQTPAPEFDFAPNSSASSSSSTSGALICDSTSVRGRFTGGEALNSGTRRSAFRESQPARRSDRVALASSASTDEWPEAAGDLESSAPSHKRSERRQVVNALAQHAAKPVVDDSAGSERAVPVNAVDPLSGWDEPHKPTLARAPKPFTPDVNHADPSATTALQSSGLEPAPALSRVNGEAWFAFGMAAGLIMSVVLWLRLRQKVGESAN
jgi:hypothetical protein